MLTFTYLLYSTIAFVQYIHTHTFYGEHKTTCQRLLIATRRISSDFNRLLWVNLLPRFATLTQPIAIPRMLTIFLFVCLFVSDICFFYLLVTLKLIAVRSKYHLYKISTISHTDTVIYLIISIYTFFIYRYIHTYNLYLFCNISWILWILLWCLLLTLKFSLLI